MLQILHIYIDNVGSHLQLVTQVEIGYPIASLPSLYAVAICIHEFIDHLQTAS